MTKLLSYLTMIVKVLTLLSFLGLILVVCLQVATRFLPISYVWTEEASRFLFIFAVAFGAPLAMQRRELVRVDTLLALLPDKVRRVYESIVYLIMGAFSSGLVFIAYDFTVIGRAHTSAAMRIPMSYIYGSMIFALALITVYSFVNAWALLKGQYDVAEGQPGKGT